MPFSYKPYEESDAVRAARANLEANQNYKESDNVSLARNILAQHEQNKVQDWTGGQYGQSLQQALDRINNREKFTYDLNGDALFQQYKDRYMTQGRMAMMDTLGQTSALTGGYGNSYAATAGNQAYQAYLTQLMDVAPQLYQMAYQRYQDEGNDLKDRLNIYQNLYNTDYGEWRDRMGDWQAEANRLTDRYYNEANMDYNRFSDNRSFYNDYYQNERNYDYNLYSDNYDRAYQEYLQALAEAQAAAGGGGGGGGGGRSGRGGSSSTDTTAAKLAEKVAHAAVDPKAALNPSKNKITATTSPAAAAIAKAVALAEQQKKKASAGGGARTNTLMTR